MSEEEIKLDRLWNKLVEELAQVFQKTSKSYSYYMGVHKDIINYFELLEMIDKQKVEEDMCSKEDDEYYLPQYRKKGQELYNFLIELLKVRVTYVSMQCENRGAKNILEFYDSEWNSYILSCNTLNGAIKYFTQCYIDTENKVNTHQLASFNDLVLDIWKNHYVEKFHNELFEAACLLTNKEQMGEKINTELISTLVKSYVKLDQNLTLYNKYFSSRYIEETKRFYISKATQYLDKNTTAAYIIKVKQWLMEESKKAYLHETTTNSLFHGCRKVLIKDHIELLNKEFQQLLSSNKTGADLESLYYLIALIDQEYGSFEAPALILKQHINSQGLLAIEKCCKSAQTNPKIYVNIILQLRTKYLTLISNRLRNNDKFLIALDYGFKGFLNRTTDGLKSAEYIAKYCDMLLTKSNKVSGGYELTKALDEVFPLIKYIKDKNGFQTFYYIHLAERLIQMKSISDDAEIYMISKLRTEKGCEYIRYFQTMIDDIKSSKNLNQEFQTHVTASGKPLHLDFNIKILTDGGWWPYKISSLAVLPLECEQAMSRFKSFVNQKYNSTKKLSWLHNISAGELAANGYPKKYTIIANALQISIISQFNQSETWTIGQLSKNTSIEMNAVVNIVQILLKVKWVICTEAENLTIDSVITINNNYKNKKLCLKINFPERVEIHIKTKEAYQLIEDDKKFLLNAAIVRLMKSRKTMKHRQLFEEVIKQMKTMFTPDIALTKKCIDDLIRKEFIVRSRKDIETYNYLP